MEETDLAGR
jgi:hypothetical protein